MNEIKLKDYNYWVGTSAEEILNAVRNVGGWTNIFPNKIPLWAHRIRNFFNREPKSLERLDAKRSAKLLMQSYAKLPLNSVGDYIPEVYALSDDVYKDAQNWVWYQMNEGGTIYHWGSDPLWAPPESLYQEVKGKLGIPAPVFKLIAPDGTGGSRETLLRNMHNRFTVVKEIDFLAYVGHLTITDYWNQGSYNYSETIRAGYSGHEKRDVDPHKKYKFPNVYVNPTDRFSPLSQRIFPEKALGESTPLANQL